MCNLREQWNLIEKKWKSGDASIIEYVDENDEKCLKQDLHLSFFYRTNVLPQPYFGNAENFLDNEDKKILVLGKNPSYEPNDDKIDTNSFLKDNNISVYFNHLDKVNPAIGEKSEFYNEFKNTINWWRKNVFADVEIKEEYEDNILFINLCAYHSTPYIKVRKDCLMDNNSYLYTQNKSKEIIFNCVQKASVILLLWGENEWRNYLSSKKWDIFAKPKLVRLNTDNSTRPLIKECLKKKEYKEKLEEYFILN